MDTINEFLVASGGGGVLIMNPPRTPISEERAVMLAAWLVAIADPGQEKFKEAYAAILAS